MSTSIFDPSAIEAKPLRLEMFQISPGIEIADRNFRFTGKNGDTNCHPWLLVSVSGDAKIVLFQRISEKWEYITLDGLAPETDCEPTHCDYSLVYIWGLWEEVVPEIADMGAEIQLLRVVGNIHKELQLLWATADHLATGEGEPQELEKTSHRQALSRLYLNLFQISDKIVITNRDFSGLDVSQQNSTRLDWCVISISGPKKNDFIAAITPDCQYITLKGVEDREISPPAYYDKSLVYIRASMHVVLPAATKVGADICMIRKVRSIKSELQGLWNYANFCLGLTDEAPRMPEYQSSCTGFNMLPHLFKLHGNLQLKSREFPGLEKAKNWTKIRVLGPYKDSVVKRPRRRYTARYH